MKIKENDFLLYLVDYLTAILFTETDNADESGGESLDLNYSIDDFNGAFYEQCKDDLARFFELAEDLLQVTEYASAAHDLWYTRNGDGCGFWDGDWDTDEDPERGDKLSEIVRENFKNVDIYIGDDGMIYGI